MRESPLRSETSRRGPTGWRDWLGAVFTVAVLLGAAWIAVPDRTTAAGPQGPVGDGSLGSLLGRDTVVRLTQTAGGPRFTVTSGDGTVLYENLTAEDLRLHFPELDPAALHAGPDDSVHRPSIDAALDPGG